jgi:adenosylcobinamide-GDP ribazoletransferase
MIFRAIALAFQFLTIIPIRTKSDISEREVYNSASFFPFVGAFQGLCLVLLSCLLLKFISLEITAVFVLLFYVLITGGFHHALSVPSSGDREKDRTKRLQVMKDSTIGPIGVIAIVFSLLLKYVLMKETLQMDSYTAKYFIIVLMPVFSKWAMVTGMYHSKSARKNGIGRIFLEHTSLKQIVLATMFLVSLTFMVAYVFDYFLPAWFLWTTTSFALFFFSEMVFIYLTCVILKYIFTARFGGLTGDNFGAMHEISEVLFLMLALLWK